MSDSGFHVPPLMKSWPGNRQEWSEWPRVVRIVALSRSPGFFFLAHPSHMPDMKIELFSRFLEKWHFLEIGRMARFTVLTFLTVLMPDWEPCAAHLPV